MKHGFARRNKSRLRKSNKPAVEVAMRSYSKILLITAVLMTPPTFAKGPPPAGGEILLREVRYDAKLTDTEARFAVELNVESPSHGEVSMPLFEGDLAVLPPSQLPAGLWLTRERNM